MPGSAPNFWTRHAGPMEFTWQEIELLASFMHVLKAHKDVSICREGSEDNSMFIIATGTVHILKEDAAGRKKVLATLGPGQTLGEMSLIDGEPRSATVVAADEVVLLSLSRAGLDDLVRDRPGLAVKFVSKLARLLSQRLRKASGVLADYLK